MDDWSNAAHAARWSADPVTHNPTRPEQLDILLSVLADEYREGTSIIDIGMGSGIVEEMLFERVPEAHLVGIDASEAMVALARERLSSYEGRYEVVMGDITRIDDVRLPDRQYSVIFSVQVVHNVEDRHKQAIISFAHRALMPGGLFLLLDRIRLDTPGLFSVYHSLWARLDRLHGARVANHEGATLDEHHAIVSRRGDMPATLERHLEWLRGVGFEAACVHLHANRALFAARKPG